MIPNAFEWIPLDDVEIKRVNVLLKILGVWDIAIVYKTGNGRITTGYPKLKESNVKKYVLTHYMILDLQSENFKVRQEDEF